MFKGLLFWNNLLYIKVYIDVEPMVIFFCWWSETNLQAISKYVLYQTPWIIYMTSYRSISSCIMNVRASESIFFYTWNT